MLSSTLLICELSMPLEIIKTILLNLKQVLYSFKGGDRLGKVVELLKDDGIKCKKISTINYRRHV